MYAMPEITAKGIEGLKKAHKVVVIDPLPAVANQVGPTCGIYALDTALRIRGVKAPPPRKGHQGGTSLRQLAKEAGLTQIGELFDAVDALTLAALAGAPDAAVHTFSDSKTLWKIVGDAVQSKRTVMFPFCVDNSVPDDSKPKYDGTSPHWCLLLGGYQNGDAHGLATQYGKFYDWSMDALVKSNQTLQKWDPQKWVKVILSKHNGKDWEEIYKGYFKEDSQDLKSWQAAAKRSPPKIRVTLLPRTASFNEINLALTLKGQCVVV
jgi:hypothetical protein